MVSVPIQYRTHKHKALRSSDQRSQDMRRNGIDREQTRERIFSDNSLRLAVADTSVMNHGIERSELINLIGNVPCLGDAGEVSNKDRFCCGQLVLRLFRPLLATSMQHHPVPLFNKKLRGRKAQTIGRSINENTSHDDFP
jgi:hypothetical protein